MVPHMEIQNKKNRQALIRHIQYLLKFILEGLAYNIITDIFIDNIGENDTQFDKNKVSIFAEWLNGREFFMIWVARYYVFCKGKT